MDKRTKYTALEKMVNNRQCSNGAGGHKGLSVMGPGVPPEPLLEEADGVVGTRVTEELGAVSPLEHLGPGRVWLTNS